MQRSIRVHETELAQPVVGIAWLGESPFNSGLRPLGAYGVSVGDVQVHDGTGSFGVMLVRLGTLTLYEQKVGGRTLDHNFGRTLVYPA